MGLYRVLPASKIRHQGIDYCSGEVVNLDTAEATFHSASIEAVTPFPLQKCGAELNYCVIADQSGQSTELFLGERYYKVASVEKAADATITFAEQHCLAVNDTVLVHDLDVCPPAAQSYLVTAVPTETTIRMGLDASIHGQTEPRGYISIPLDLTGAILSGSVWAPAEDFRFLTNSATAKTSASSSRIELVSDCRTGHELLPGDLLTVEGTSVIESKILALGDPVCADRKYVSVVEVENVSSSAVEGAAWRAKRKRLKSEKGDLIEPLPITIVDATLGHFKINFPQLSKGDYFYSVQKSVGGEVENVLAGWIEYA